MEIYGYTYVVDKKQERKKRKHMDERKEIQQQYFHNKFVSKNIISIVSLN